MARLTALFTCLCICLVGGTACSAGGDSGHRTTDKTTEPGSRATVTVTASPQTQPTPAVESEPSPRPTSTHGVAPAPVRSPVRKPVRRPARRPAPPVDLSGYSNPGFTTPSGNIGCQFDTYNRPHVRCDRLAMDRVPPGKPAACDFDWGHSVELSAGDRGALACTSDSVMGQQGETDGTRALPYGDSVRFRGIVCTSTMQGLRCHTSGGHGFLLSRATIRVR